MARQTVLVSTNGAKRGEAEQASMVWWTRYANSVHAIEILAYATENHPRCSKEAPSQTENVIKDDLHWPDAVAYLPLSQSTCSPTPRR